MLAEMYSEAYVSTMIGFSRSECFRIGAVVKAVLSLSKACGAFEDHANVRSLCVSWVSG